jgi:hypothetical protein
VLSFLFLAAANMILSYLQSRYVNLFYPSHSLMPNRYKSLYNMLSLLLNEICSHNFAPVSSLAICFKSFFKIFPEAFFGIASTNLTPPTNCLYPASLSLIYACTSVYCNCLPCFNTIYALGSSVPCSPAAPPAVTPMTAASLTSGCDNKTPSSSAGAT